MSDGPSQSGTSGARTSGVGAPPGAVDTIHGGTGPTPKRKRGRPRKPLTGTQVCTACGVEKPMSEYTFLPSRGTYPARCRECNKAICIEYRRGRGTGSWARYVRDQKREAQARAMRVIENDEKRCSKCGKLRPLSEFYREHRQDGKGSLDGYRPECKRCCKDNR